MSFSTFSPPLPTFQAAARATRWRPWAAAAAAGLALTACGGGTSQYEAFVPGRVLVVGDELSTLDADGRKYAVNGLKEDGTSLNCAAEPLWVQQVAGAYGMVFKECNPDNSTTNVTAIMRAAPNARVADLAAQVEAQVAAGGFRENDLVLALGGVNDVLDLYRRFVAGESVASMQAEARVRGENMAAVVNRLVDLNAKVIVSTLPDLGLSPLATAEEAANPGAGRAAVLASLTALFNERLGVKVRLDGRYVGLMQADLRTQLAARFPSSYGLADATSDVCLPASPPPGCTTKTLLTETTAASAYFWAGGTWLSTGGQSQLASLALERAARNPF